MIQDCRDFAFVFEYQRGTFICIERASIVVQATLQNLK